MGMGNSSCAIFHIIIYSLLGLPLVVSSVVKSLFH
jgi:hypothetical protein